MTTPIDGLAAPHPITPSFWRSLRFFNLYRVGVATVFLLISSPFGSGNDFGSGSGNAGLFFLVSASYLVLALVFLLLLPRLRLEFNLLLSIEVVADIIVLTLVMHATGGSRSGFGYMLLVVLAAAGLVGQGRLTVFYAAVATIAVLFEQSFRALLMPGEAVDFTHTGSICLGFFGTAVTAHLLARRVVLNEELADRRGAELADQQRINRQVIRDMQDGVLVVDGAGRIRQYNPRALTLLAIRAPNDADLHSFCPALAERYSHWRNRQAEVSEAIRIPGSGRLLRARFLPPAESGDALIYLEDLERVQARTQQVKLAALGRLTANMAHEIRNPLSAISHAAELLAEGDNGDQDGRLTRIIRDNAQRLNRLVAEVLELGRRDQAKPETIKLPKFIDAFIEDLALHNERARAAIAASVVPGTMACFDRGHLHRILANLVGNALRYCSGKAGSVRIEAIEVGNRIEIHVVDDGPGIAPDSRGQVFEPFYTTDHQGTGLGLYIARELCEANDAALSVLDNSPGAHFCISARGEACPQRPSEEAALSRAAS
jgi:two-component system sensor histidine kinase PilS (NtrC family)